MPQVPPLPPTAIGIDSRCPGQRETGTAAFSFVSRIPPFRAGIFKASGSFDPMQFGESARRFPAPFIIVSMSPPSYPSAWLHPCRARFRFAWRNHCSASPTLTHNNIPPTRLLPLADPELRRLVLPIARRVYRHSCAQLLAAIPAPVFEAQLTHRFLQRSNKKDR